MLHSGKKHLFDPLWIRCLTGGWSITKQNYKRIRNYWIATLNREVSILPMFWTLYSLFFCCYYTICFCFFLFSSLFCLRTTQTLPSGWNSFILSNIVYSFFFLWIQRVSYFLPCVDIFSLVEYIWRWYLEICLLQEFLVFHFKYFQLWCRMEYSLGVGCCT